MKSRGIHTVFRFFQRAYHLGERTVREGRVLPKRMKAFGAKVALESFWDGLIPPGKSERYIATIAAYVDRAMQNVTKKYRDEPVGEPEPELPAVTEKTPIWCCWWQGEAQMPEIVRMCHARLKQVIPTDRAELHLITLENYASYVNIEPHILDKFNRGVITMTTMSDVLRFKLLEKYGGYWLDATLFFSGDIPEEYFTGRFYCQRMEANLAETRREACRGKWCGFSMAGEKGNVVFRYMNDAFSAWWKENDLIIDYVQIDYLLMTGYRAVPAIRAVIDSVPDNNEDIFCLYRMLNQPYSRELYERLTARNVMHKLTYKMDLQKKTPEGQLTLYGYLLNEVYGSKAQF